MNQRRLRCRDRDVETEIHRQIYSAEIERVKVDVEAGPDV